MARYWINSISLDHVLLGVEGGFTQAGHGRDTRLRRLSRGDGMVFYSPRTALSTGRRLQQFTALGVVVDDEPYQVEVREGLLHWRRRMTFEQVAPVPVRPLLPVLGFVDDEEHWGLPFRRGLFEVPAGDFNAVAGALRDGAADDAPVIGARA
ncbi:EVE domain-containing protein [Nocardioides sp. C4-1]|uniref:EVE domain-containing protein n=1 Tax=Nocardioides sp. C4-1 TaxID=3151851 RepID=UPI0032634E52